MNIKAVAKKAGVSVATVSRVLNHPDAVAPDTKEHILAVMESLEYTPNWFARGLKLNRTGVIALLIPEILDLGYMEIAKGVEDVAHQKIIISCCAPRKKIETRKKGTLKFYGKKCGWNHSVSSFLKKNDLIQMKKQDISVVLIGKNEELQGENLSIRITFATVKQYGICWNRPS